MKRLLNVLDNTQRTQQPYAMTTKSAATAIYLRVSTAIQTTECQRPDVDRLVAASGYNVVATYEEQASAAKYRPEFERMMVDARAGKFTVLVVWALDRFGRSMAGNVRDVIELDKIGVRIVSVKEPWMNTDGPVRELLVAIFSWVAQQERERLIERTKAGIAVARAAGKRIGRVSPVMVAPPLRAAIVGQWRAAGGTDYRALGVALGGVSGSTAWRVEKAVPVSTETIEQFD